MRSTYVIEKLVFVLLLMLEELVEAVRLVDTLRLVRKENGVTIECDSQLSLGHLRQLVRREHGGCRNACGNAGR